ncbi:MAG: acyl carrier protein [Clostridia bacterium]|nr:acyl carrier protein [Clostridia bacterium]
MPQQSRDEIAKKVCQTLADIIGVDSEQLHGHTELVRDLHLDSLSIFELVIELEESYHLQIPDEDIDRIRTIDDIVDYILQKLKEK